MPLAAPSANKFSKTSPTSPQHVLDSLGAIPVLDGGECAVGIESTIISLQLKPRPKIQLLRPGMLHWAEIKEFLKNEECEFVAPQTVNHVPGSLEDHYMPNIPLVLLEQDLNDQEMLQMVNKKLKQNFKSFAELKLPKESYIAARELYARLHELNHSHKDFMIFRLQDYMLDADWWPLTDRLQKASTFKI